jgi:hypothetical protein
MLESEIQRPWSFPDWVEKLPSAKPFAKGVIETLRQPLEFEDRVGRKVGVLLVGEVEPAHNLIGEELRFTFQIATDLAPPSLGKPPEPDADGLVRIKGKAGTVVVPPPKYGFTFTNRLSLEQNIANLRDFVLRQIEESNLAPQIESGKFLHGKRRKS